MLVGGRESYRVFLHLMAAEYALPDRTFPARKQRLHFGLLLATAVALDVVTRCCASRLYHLFLHLSVCNHGNDLLSFVTKTLLALVKASFTISEPSWALQNVFSTEKEVRLGPGQLKKGCL